jgi:hypothetical protein
MLGTDLRRISELRDAVRRDRWFRAHHEVCLSYADSRGCNDNEGGEMHVCDSNVRRNSSVQEVKS